MKLQFGAGLDGPSGWINCDASPTLWLQRLPLAGALFRRFLKPCFSRRVIHGDVVRGLPFPTSSVRLVYSSHTLEHLAFQDLRAALREVYRVLEPGGVFRSVMPDLAVEVRDYLASEAADPASDFMRSTLLGQESRPRNLAGRIRVCLGNSGHLWLWDYRSIAHQLAETGFVDIRPARLHDSAHSEFRAVEAPERWERSLGFECSKPPATSIDQRA